MRRFKLDPRSKFLLLTLITTIVLGGVGGNDMEVFIYILSAVPVLLLLSCGQFKQALIGGGLIVLANLGANILIGQLTGTLGFVILLFTGIISRLLPGVLMGKYLIETTTVSEFIAAFQKMHIPDQLTIPLSVMFRFFPTIGEEFHSINAAMRMRDIRLTNGSIIQNIEYRLIPMINCSVRIGEELSASALSRGLYGDAKRTNICKIGFGMADYPVLVFSVICIVCVIAKQMGVAG